MLDRISADLFSSDSDVESLQPLDGLGEAAEVEAHQRNRINVGIARAFSTAVAHVEAKQDVPEELDVLGVATSFMSALATQMGVDDGIPHEEAVSLVAKAAREQLPVISTDDAERVGREIIAALSNERDGERPFSDRYWNRKTRIFEVNTFRLIELRESGARDGMVWSLADEGFLLAMRMMESDVPQFGFIDAAIQRAISRNRFAEVTVEAVRLRRELVRVASALKQKLERVDRGAMLEWSVDFDDDIAGALDAMERSRESNHAHLEAVAQKIVDAELPRDTRAQLVSVRRILEALSSSFSRMIQVLTWVQTSYGRLMLAGMGRREEQGARDLVGETLLPLMYASLADVAGLAPRILAGSMPPTVPTGHDPGGMLADAIQRLEEVIARGDPEETEAQVLPVDPEEERVNNRTFDLVKMNRRLRDRIDEFDGTFTLFDLAERLCAEASDEDERRALTMLALSLPNTKGEGRYENRILPTRYLPGLADGDDVEFSPTGDIKEARK